ncbi:MAG TPA: oxygen-independent coproporphyrinogen III oxidase [Phycisphaerae bacterium]|nr:oxygen-independent coproporphyrinogen III oxidase [Phycisphaerae bacterium]
MSPMLKNLNLDVFHKYAGLALPRHVAYPMPTWWRDVSPAEAAEMLRASRQRSPAADLSLYIHVPFCERTCRYCACTRMAQDKHRPEATSRTAAYVEALEREIRGFSESLGNRPVLRQMHWGGGTPTYLEPEQIERLCGVIAEVFEITPDAEISIELDPRVTGQLMLETLRGLGFNRVSLGVQDFDPIVQRHAGRIQSLPLVDGMVQQCRELGFESVNFDLIYGLPYQTVDTVRATLEKTIDLAPDRIAYYQYAQIPDKIAAQRGLDVTKLPDSEAKLEMYLLGQEMLPAAGYVFIGLDHFAKPEERLAVALREGTLQRNFQGMTTGGGLDLIGAGPSAIGQLTEIGFLQNRRDVNDYIDIVQRGESPVYRGKRFTHDDNVRQAVIAQIYCRAEICPAEIEAQTGVVFEDYFAREVVILDELARDGLVEAHSDGSYRLTDPLGRVLMRTVGAVFDAYLAPDAYRVGDRQYFSANA